MALDKEVSAALLHGPFGHGSGDCPVAATSLLEAAWRLIDRAVLPGSAVFELEAAARLGLVGATRRGLGPHVFS